jgi:hypothetical protein
MQQSPQKTSEQYSQTSYSFLSECFPFFYDHSKYLLVPLFTSSNRNRRSPRRASISPCISNSRSLQLPSWTTHLGRLLVPSPTTANSNVFSYAFTIAIEASTTNVAGS